MPKFSDAELAGMQAAQADHMNDTCVILVYSSTTDENNMPKPAYTAGSPLSCGFRARTPKEVLARAEVAMSDGDVRLPIGTTLDRRSRIKLTYRYGSALSPAPVYEIIGEPLRGPSGLLVLLKRATDGQNG
jgi:hypothetical protein